MTGGVDGGGAGAGAPLRAVAYLTAASLKNRVVVQLRRLRSPRALVAGAAGAAYMWWFLFRPAARPAAGALLSGAGWALPVAALVVLGLPAFWWLARGGTAASAVLAFTPAEEHLLFPAPVSRRGLVHWKLWRAQLAVLFNTVLFTVLLRGGAGHAGAWARALAVWLLLSTLQLHRLAAALVTAPAGDGAAPARAARWAPALVLAALGGAVAFTLAPRAGALAAAWDAGPFVFGTALGAALDRTPARWALWPTRALLGPFFALGGPSAGAYGAAAFGAGAARRAWAATLPAAVLLVVAHYAWVVRVDARITEAALDAGAARRRARARARTRAPGAAARRAIPLAPGGAPAVALVWKNWLAFTRATALVRILTVLGVAAAGTLVLAARSPRFAELATLVAATWGALLVAAGPLWVRYDLRHDLPHLPFLKAVPLAGRTLVAAEIGASVLALTAVQVAALLFLLAAAAGSRDGLGLTVGERLVYALALALALPGLNAATLTVQNGMALLFPAWTRAPGAAARGIEATGQNLVGSALTLATSAVLLAVPAGVAVGIAWALQRTSAARLGPWIAVPPAVLFTLGAVAVLWPVVRWLGRVFDRTDPPESAA
ncbi:hypothetical protein tb265_17250 [Gemmatimonadetes bacterium T265]|nr:hypothetical protein tb265_17250 [Gemmatimonadetes bacterium T265]